MHASLCRRLNGSARLPAKPSIVVCMCVFVTQKVNNQSACKLHTDTAKGSIRKQNAADCVCVCVWLLRLNRYASVIDKLHKASLWYPHCSYPAPTPYLCYSNHNRHQIPHRCPIPFPFQCPSPLQLCGESCVCVCLSGGITQPCRSLYVCVCLQVCVRVFLAWLPLPVARCPLPCLADE